MDISEHVFSFLADTAHLIDDNVLINCVVIFYILKVLRQILKSFEIWKTVRKTKMFISMSVDSCKKNSIWVFYIHWRKQFPSQYTMI